MAENFQVHGRGHSSIPVDLNQQDRHAFISVRSFGCACGVFSASSGSGSSDSDLGRCRTSEDGPLPCVTLTGVSVWRGFCLAVAEPQGSAILLRAHL